MAPPHRTPPRLRDYFALTKPEVNLLVLMATAAGYYLAATGPFRAGGLANTLLGTLLVASGTATLNQWMERTWDAQMRRTAHRPLPSGRLRSGETFVFGTSLSLAGGLYLAFAVNGLAAVLAISTLLSYLLIYTPLKRRTSLCTLAGAIPGALPTLIGWAGASAAVNTRAWLLFAVLFLWQFPHFLAIALMYRQDYARAGYKMLPDFDADGRFTRCEIVATSLILVVITLLVGLRGGAIPVIAAALAGAFFLYPVGTLMKTGSQIAARRVLHASVVYLPLVLVMATAWKS